MGDGGPAGRPAPGNPAAPASPLRIFTRVNGGEQAPGGLPAAPRDGAAASLGSAFARPHEDGAGSRPPSSHRGLAEGHAGGRAAKAAPRVGRQGANYHPLPSHWRDYVSSPSSAGSPVTPDSGGGGGGGGGEYPGALQTMNMAGIAGLPASYTPEPARPLHIPRDNGAGKHKLGLGRSPASSPYSQLGNLGDAFGSVSSLEWTNDRPTSTLSHLSADQQAESPLDIPGYSSHFPPSLSTLAARSGAQRGAISANRHHPSASTSSSHHSFSMGSPLAREPGAAALASGPRGPSSSLPPTAIPSPAPGAGGESPASVHGEDIVRRYFGRPPPQQPPPPQQQQPQQQSPQQPPRSQPTGLSPLGKASSGSSTSDEAARSIVYRRAVSSGDLPTLDELHGALRGTDVESNSSGFLSHDLVESPLEALVRRLTIELFQLYVSEDRQKGFNGKRPGDGPSAGVQGQPDLEDEYGDIAESLSRVLDPLTTDEGYVQQFRLGPSLDSGSTTPAVTMDGYFMPQAPGARADTPTGAAIAGADPPPLPRPRPRHRQLERTWMEEALIKARRVSTIDETAGEAILQGLDMEAAAADGLPMHDVPSLRTIGSPRAEPYRAASPRSDGDPAQLALRTTRRGLALPPGVAGEARGMPQLKSGGGKPRPGLPSVSEEGSDAAPSGDDGTTPRSHYRARDPAAPHRQATAGISPARASLLRAVGRRQSVRLQPGKGQIVVSDTPTEMRPDSVATAGSRSSIIAPVPLDPETVARAKRTNSLPGIMQVPETREVSYRDIQRKAARPVELKKAAKSRARVVRRAERMVRGGTQALGSRRRHHRRGGSRAPDMEQLLVRVELPPPVPLRVRRQQLRTAPEPLIIVCRPAKRPPSGDVATTEQRIQRVHNQLLGAQAVLSRHNSELRQADAAVRSPGKNTMRNQALDAMMLDSAFGDPAADNDDDDRERRRAADARQRRECQGDMPGADCATEAAPARPWRNARRRSTLRQKERQRQLQNEKRARDDGRPTPERGAAGVAIEAQLPRQLAPTARRQLLLHGPAYRIYSGFRARPDTHLFLFTDVLVVAVRLGAAQAYAGADSLLAVPMAPPAADPAAIPPGSRFRVQIVIPLVHQTTELTTQREGASKRPGEDDDAEERRIDLQEERIRRACHIFEKNTSEAVVYLVNHDIISPQADMVAAFLHRCTALSRRQTGCFLGSGIMGENLHENPTADEVEQEKVFHRQTWAAFIGQCNIVGVPVDEALRSILFYFRLPASRRPTGILLEIIAVEWFARSREYGPADGVYVPESQDVAVKLVYSIMMLNSEVHNPMVRSDVQSDAIYQAFLSRFRASVVDDPALTGKRKGNVLRKRDQPRVVTIMEVPTDCLRAIYERIVAKRLVTCSDTCAMAPEFDIEWVRDASDAGAAPLTDEQIEAEIEDIYSDPGFRDGILFNATSDRLPAKFSIDPPAWVRVTVRIPEPDSDFSISVRVVGATADATGPPAGTGAEPIAILPSNRLSLHTGAASFVIRPQQVGHFTIHFISEGPRARYYHPIPPRKIAVEGAFMRQTVQLAWNRGGSGGGGGGSGSAQGSHGRHVFGLDSVHTKGRWVHALEAALRGSAGLPPEDVLRSAENVAQALAALAPEHSRPSSSRADGAATAGRGAAAPGVSSMQLLGALGVL